MTATIRISGHYGSRVNGDNAEPPTMMLVLTFVFSYVFRFSVEGYAVYVLSGLVLWNFFAQTTTSAMPVAIAIAAWYRSPVAAPPPWGTRE